MDRSHRLKAAKGLYLIADRQASQTFETFIEQLEQALKGGLKLVQFRDKTSSNQVYYKEALVIQQLTKRYHALLICNDRLDVAMAIEADGVHIGQSDLPIEAVRRLVGNRMIVGQTCKTLEEFHIAEANRADYIGTGAFYPTSTKPDARQSSHAYLADLIKNTALPVYGIGGVTIDRIVEVMATGTRGVAISSAIMAAPSPEEAVKQALERLKAFV